MLPSEPECREIAARALGFARADDAAIVLQCEHEGHTRFANNEITTAGERETTRVVVSVTRDGRSARVETGETSDAALEDAFRRAAAQAALLPADPESVGPLPPQRYLAVGAWDEAAAAQGPAERIARVRAVVTPADRRRTIAAGFASDTTTVRCVANKAGNFGYHRSTEAELSATVRTTDGTGSGWASRTSHRAADLDAAAIGARALAKGLESAKPTPIEPGDYTVILEPAAVSELLGGGFAQAFAARTAEEGRSYFSKKGGGTLLGEKLFHESVTLRSDPADPRLPAVPWSVGGGFGNAINLDQNYGLAVAPTTWVEHGVLRNLSYDRYWALKSEREPMPPPSSLIVEGGAETIESLIASTERGLLITNFWYVRSVNPQSMQLTGLTRDGVWLIEKGRIVRPVVNLRFNESPAVLFQNVVGMTPAERVSNRVAPAIKATGFTFSSLSDAV